MRITKKLLALILSCFLVMSFSLISMADDTVTDETVTEEVTTFITTLQPDNYAIIHLQKGSANTADAGYHKSTRPLDLYYNTLYTGYVQVYSEHSSIITGFEVPLKSAVDTLAVTYELHSVKNLKNGHVPIFYDLNRFVLDTADGTYSGPSTTTTTDEAGNSVTTEVPASEQYAAVKSYTENYWVSTGTTNHKYSSTQLPFVSQVAETMSTTTAPSTGTVAFTLNDAMLTTFKSNTASDYITLSTGRETSGYIELQFSIDAKDEIPYLTATYSKDELVNIINTATADTISATISDMAQIGLFNDTTAGKDGYSSLILVAKEYVESQFINKISNGGFSSVEEICAFYDEAVAYAQKNGMLMAINGAESQAETKSILDEMALESYVALSDMKKNYVANELYKIASTDGFSLIDDFYAQTEVLITAITAPIVGEITSGNDALVYVTQHSDNADRKTGRALNAYYNTLSSSSTTNHNAQWVSIISEFDVWNKNAVTKAEVGYTTNKGAMDGRNVPIFYYLNGFDMELSAGVYAGPVAAKEATETTEAVDAIPASDEYNKIMEFVNQYWPKDNGYSSSGATLPLAVNMTNSTILSGNGVRSFFDVTSAINALKADEENSKITFATGRANHKDSNMRFKYESASNVPTLRLTYDSDALTSYINTATDDGKLKEVIKTLGDNGLLEETSTYKYAGYTGLGEDFKKMVRDELVISNDGFFSYIEFIKAYDDAIFYAVNSVINNPEIYVSFDDETASNIKGENNDGTVHGTPSFIDSFNGSKALRIENEFGKEAQQYVDFGEYDFSEGNFSIVFWMRAPERGIQYEETGDTIADADIVDFSSYTGTKGGVVLSNKDFSSPDSAEGFAFAAMPIYSDFAVNMKVGENAAINNDGYQRSVDSRWHQVAYVVNRGGKATVYVDDYAILTTDISSLEGSLGNGNLVLGADALGQYGMMKGEFDEFKVYSSALETNKITELYYMSAIKKVSEDMKKLISSDNASLYTSDDITELNEKIAALDSYILSYEAGYFDELKEKFEENDTYFDNFLNRNVKSVAAYGSDIHISENNENHLSAQNLKRLLTESENWEVPAKSFVLSGDLADVGADDLRYYFKYMNNWTLPGSNVVMCRGNHDEPAGSEKDTGISYTKAQMLQKYIDGVETFVNKEFGFNKALLSNEGKLTQPYYYATDGFAHYISIDTYIPKLGQLTDAELEWAKNVLANISGDGKPIFWVQHPPMWGTFPYGRIENDKNQLLKEYDIKIKNIIKDYDNIIFLNGHNHEAYASGAVRPASINFEDGTPTGAYQVNAPILASKSIIRGYEWAGGYYINIYDDRVVFRARDFENQRWLRDYDVTVPLKAATKTPVVTAGGVYYNSLEEAVENAYNGDEIKFLCDLSGNGITLDAGKDLTINLNGFTYTVTGDITESGSVFEISNGSKLTLKNGEVKSENENIANIISIKGGSLTVSGNTSITANDAQTAVYSYYFKDNSDINIIFDEKMTGKVTGEIVLAGEEGYELNTKVCVSSGTFTQEIQETWCALGYVPAEFDDGTYGVVKTVVTVSESGVKVENAPSQYTLIIASYNGNKLIDVKFANKAEITFLEAGLITENATEIKAMLWSSVDSMIPLSK